ncbi:MAG: thiamine-phosphate kinase [Proteobacteria bacterium]|nr:thiamine-phosphate kinase [Pseudomonadota bacterium]
MEKESSTLSELQIIEHIQKYLGPSADRSVIKGIGDDCAVLRKNDRECLLITIDTLVEGVHFDLAWHPPFLLGRKTGAVNVSDIAAMGGQPRFALLSLAFPGSAPAWLDDFLAGFHEMLQEHDTHLVGGDTVKSSNDLSISVTIIGEAAEEVICYRSGAETGDLIFVSSTLGDAAAGLALCKTDLPSGDSEKWQQLINAHLDPQPQVQLGKILAQSSLVHAMMDISDGLATDLAHICKESGAGAEIIKGELPVSPQLQSASEKTGKPVLDWVLKGGEDYELLFTVSPDHEQELRNLVLKKTGQEIFCIGRIIEGKGVFLSDGTNRKEVSFQGYDHFND